MMKMSMAKIALFTTLFFCLIEHGFAQEYRLKMQMPPAKLYSSMLKLAERGDYPKIAKSLPFLDEVFSEEKEKFGVDMKKEIETALRGKKNSTVVTAIQQAIFYDIMDIFFAIREEGNSESAKTLKTWLMMANLDHKLLSSSIKDRSFKTNQEIEQAFFRSFALLNVEASPLMADRRDKKVDMAALEELLNGIEENILSVFPEFKRPKQG